MKVRVAWDGRDYLEFDYPPFMMREGILFESLTGQHPVNFATMLDKRELPAMQFAVWLACERNGEEPPSRNPGDIDFDMLSFRLDLQPDPEEQAQLDAQKADNPEVPTTSDEEGSGIDITP